MTKHRILVVDDNASTLRGLRAILRDEGYEVETAANGLEAERSFHGGEPFDIVLADLKMPGLGGMDLFRRLRSLDPQLLFIIMTAHGSIESSVSALKEGVYDYLVKPLNMDELILVLDKALRERRRDVELATLREEVAERYVFHNIVGQSQDMQQVFQTVRAVAPTDATVLISGETGTGKEMVTKAIHYHSDRKEAPIICVNCAALSESLLEAELFGYVKGAFTGAVSNRIGRLEAAHRGTLFLDEVGQMSLPLQAKMLRFLQERTFEPVGSITPRAVDVRVIAATNRELEEEVHKERFLPDLYYRLQVIQLTIPPLRDRSDDVPLLAEHFLEIASKQHNRAKMEIGKEVMDALLGYSWPGNVRELRNTMERLVILNKSREIALTDLPAGIQQNLHLNEQLDGYIKHLPKGGMPLRDLEKELILKTLDMFDGNRSLTAKALGISRKSLYERLLRYEAE